jgi:superfamily II RNA helicase
VLRQIIKKRPLNLESKFRVTYNMISNQIKAQETEITAIVQKSFKQKDIITGVSK